jgi:hypothetical protein
LLDRPGDGRTECGGVSSHGRQSRVSTGFETGDLPLAGAHPLRDRGLGESGLASVRSELSREFSTFERGRHTQTQTRVVVGEVINERVKIVTGGNDTPPSPQAISYLS